jgi:YegS/Rv2252/BmrU family lipid kinase
LEGGAGLIVVVGGDGTVCEAVNGFMQVDVARRAAAALAIVPRGSGCDLARMFGLARDPSTALMVALDGAIRTLDVGRAAADGRVRYFLNVASAGLSADVAERAARSRKRLGARAAYAWAAFTVFRESSRRLQHVEVDGRAFEIVGTDVIVANCRYFAGGMKVLPWADPEDGLLDVLIWGEVTAADYVRNLPGLYRGTHVDHPKATLARGARVAVSSPTDLRVEVDGELFGRAPVEFTVERAAIRLRTPAPARARRSVEQPDAEPQREEVE